MNRVCLQISLSPDVDKGLPVEQSQLTNDEMDLSRDGFNGDYG